MDFKKAKKGVNTEGAKFPRQMAVKKTTKND